MAQMNKAERLLAQHNDRLAGGRPGTAGNLRANLSVSGIDTEGLNAFMPGYNEASPRSQRDKISDYLSAQLHAKNIVPARVYSMADTRRNGEVKFSAILEALNKILPHLNQDFLEQVPVAFEMNFNEVLTPDDFNMIFDRKAAHSAPNTVPKPSATKIASAKKAYAENEDYTAILKYLA